MRWCRAASLLLCVLLAQRLYGDQEFPYTAYINSDDVYVRSGPGRNYYPTSKLQAGDKVEVYRHDPGGWYAVRPVEGSFSWVSGRYLEVGNDGIARVTGDRVAARVGSQFSDIRDVIQVRLHQGELVEVLAKKEFGSEPGSGTWYKIAPPSGEFRWVFGKFVDPNYHRSGVRKVPAGYSPLVGRRGPATDPVAKTKTARTGEKEASAAGPTAERVRTAEHWAVASSRTEPSPRQDATSAANAPAAGPNQVAADVPVRHTNKFVEPARDPSGEATLRRLSPEEFQAELDEIDIELSIMLAEEPTVWEFDELAVRTQALWAEAETAVERGRVRLLANKLAQSEDIKRRHDAIHIAQMSTERHNRQLSRLAEARVRVRPQAAAAGRFDGQGRLARVVPPKLGSPRYALVDEAGQVRCYVTPAPGVNLHYYVGRQIGVNGIRGYLAEGRARHVTAKHVTPLGDPRLR